MTNTPTDTSVQKLHKSPADSKLHKTQIAPDNELVEAIEESLNGICNAPHEQARLRWLLL